MRIKDELFGKEVLDADIQIVGKVTDVVFDKDTLKSLIWCLKEQDYLNKSKPVKTLFQWNL